MMVVTEMREEGARRGRPTTPTIVGVVIESVAVDSAANTGPPSSPGNDGMSDRNKQGEEEDRMPLTAKF